MNNNYNHEPTSSLTLKNIRDRLPLHLSGHRLQHTYSVEKQAIELAEIFFPYLDIDKEYYRDISAAALLHDITKQVPTSKHIDICLKNGICPDCSEAVLHSRTGAYAAKELFGINDIVFGAIYCHTTGKSDMNIFEKIVFISDYIEPLRTHESCIGVRNYFYENINKYSDKLTVLNTSILMSIDATLGYLINKKNKIDIETINARNSVISELANHFRGV